MRKFFLDPERGRSQDERQRVHAQQVIEQEAQRRQRERALWNRPSPQLVKVPARGKR